MANLYRVSNAKSRSISPENFTGEKGKAGMATEGTGKRAASELGQGWKVSPSVVIKAKSTFTLCDIAGPGQIHVRRGMTIRSPSDGESERVCRRP